MKSASQDIRSSVSQPGAQVLDFGAFKSKKTMVGDRSRGVQDAFRASQKMVRVEAESVKARGLEGDESQLSVRIERIKSSIQRINRLMTELRTMSDQDTKRS